jgi:poly-beta-1,6-N-acetyl-D-glucosamine synthase
MPEPALGDGGQPSPPLKFVTDLWATSVPLQDSSLRDKRSTARGRVVVLVPAHNEEQTITRTLQSLAGQTELADEVIVVADRCTDRTAAIAAARGATVFITRNNRHKKAGALNQALDHFLPSLSDQDAVLVMDADTALSPGFIAAGAQRLREPRGLKTRIGAVGGIFLADPVTNKVMRLQENEYLRYALDVGRRKGRAEVLTGTATLFSVRALRDVKAARTDGRLPASEGIYDVKALTEDNELTLALKHLRYHLASPRECVVATECMPTIRQLFYQRLRWQRGALENLVAYGLTGQTLPYIANQSMMYAAVAFVPFFLTMFIGAWLRAGAPQWSWPWIAVTVFAVAERVWTVRAGGGRTMRLSALVLPEIAFDMFLNCVYVKALADAVTRTSKEWAEPDEGSGKRNWHGVDKGLCVVAFVAPVIGLAILCAYLGVAWTIITVFVLSGVGRAGVRMLRLDPMGLFRDPGELTGLLHRGSFGGTSVHADQLEAILTRARELTGVERASLIALCDQQNQFVRLTAAENALKRTTLGPLPRGRGRVEALRGVGCLLNRADSDVAGFRPRHGQLLAAKLLADGVPYGRLYLADKRDRSPFTAGDADILVNLVPSGQVHFLRTPADEEPPDSAEPATSRALSDVAHSKHAHQLGLAELHLSHVTGSS